MEDLVRMLKTIESDFKIQSVYGFIPEVNNKIVYEASILASKLLITNTGKCNWRNIELLKMEGYDVVPLEKDSCGWLVGGIETRKGTITFD